MKYLLLLVIVFSIGLISAEINYNITWNEEDIINGKEFNIHVKINGENNEIYDGKLWIENEGTIISERYDNKNNAWKSSYYYLNQYFEGNEKEQEVKLRINKKYENFNGDAYIHFKVRDKKEIKKDIIVIKIDKEKNDDDKNDNQKIQKEDKIERVLENKTDENSIEFKNKSEEEIKIEPITLGRKIYYETENTNNEIIYKSKQMRMVNYSIYGFSVLSILLCIFIIWKKL